MHGVSFRLILGVAVCCPFVSLAAPPIELMPAAAEVQWGDALPAGGGGAIKNGQIG